ncbi:LysR family transcriptional regulator [Agrobacterium salinitolerans]|uniref:LysR family transcriptional regulator n=1 Tax=Agrobacterium salinitolerans TaxID=1183413 RepID=UPI0015743FAD|nr:LysR substrate-binding domain-containing protein [Agrobacterium salinitolerans]NTA40245.1 LysR family transcriptional regulator [Agrobacterium salinitolerans]
MRRYLDRRLKLQMLRVVDAIDAQGSILKASAKLGMSQPALTKTLRELEEITQIQLFERHTRGVRVTEAGIQVLKSGRKILAEVVRLDEELDLIHNPERGRISVGALPVTATGLLPGVLMQVKDRHPDLQVRLHEGRTEELLPKLVSGELDLIVGRLYEPIRPDGLLREPLWVEPISLLARTGHPIFSEITITKEHIRSYELVFPTVSQRIGQEIEHVLADLDVEPMTGLRSNAYGFIREMLLGTNVVAAMPRLMMVGDLLRGTLKVISVPLRAPIRPAGLIMTKTSPLPLPAKAFVDCLRHYIDEISDQGLVSKLGTTTEASDIKVDIANPGDVFEAL